MRHGDRMDNFVPNWVKYATRPWYPPLTIEGKNRAFHTGVGFRTRLDCRIDRVFVSPFLRCVQTAAEVINGLCYNGTDDDGTNFFDFSMVKVAIEYGLCEMLSREAIRLEVGPIDGKFDFDLSELEATLPAGTVDHNVQRIYQEMPRWEETVLSSRSRYEHAIHALANKYPRENFLLITHGEGVGTSIATFKKHAVAYEVNYCGYSHAKRRITFTNDVSFNAGSFQLLTASEETGVGYFMSNYLADGV